jgi:hypothetical protein
MLIITIVITGSDLSIISSRALPTQMIVMIAAVYGYAVA